MEQFSQYSSFKYHKVRDQNRTPEIKREQK